MRNYYRDDPIRDAEDNTEKEDPRPLVGHCEVCGMALHGGSEGWDPDDGYEIGSEFICADCLHEYFKDYRIK